MIESELVNEKGLKRKFDADKYVELVSTDENWDAGAPHQFSILHFS